MLTNFSCTTPVVAPPPVPEDPLTSLLESLMQSASQPSSLPNTEDSIDGKKITVSPITDLKARLINTKSYHIKTRPSAQETVVLQIHQGKGHCSSVLVAPNLLLTAAHCMDPDIVAICDNQPVGVSIARLSPSDDLAILKLNRACKGVQISRLAKKDPSEASDVWSVSYPGHIGSQMVTKGIVSAYMADSAGHLMMLTDVTFWFGSSGSALFNNKGEVVAIADQMFKDESHGESIMWRAATPVSVVWNMLDSEQDQLEYTLPLDIH